MGPDNDGFDLAAARKAVVEYVSVPFTTFVTFVDIGVDVSDSLALGADDAEPAGKVGVCKAG